MDLINKLIERLIGKHGFPILFTSILLSIYFVMWLENWIKDQFSQLPSISDAIHAIFSIVLLIFFIKVFLLIWGLLFSLYLLVARFFKNTKTNSMPKISEWIFQGGFKIIGDSLEITSSNSGCLIKNRQYKNFVMSFNIEIKNGGRAGIVFRAQDLENYLMIQLVLADHLDGSGTIIQDIIPHIRFLGNWETFNITPTFTSKPEPYYPTKVRYYSGILVVLEVKDNVAILTIKSNDIIEEFKWNIPTHVDPNLKQYLLDRTEEGDLLTRLDPLAGKFVPKIWFRNKHGMVGFRAHSWEKIVINRLRIEEI